MTVRPATLADVPAIAALVAEHAQRGEVLPRTAATIRNTVNDWMVGEKDGGLVACVSLLRYTPHLAEVRSLAVRNGSTGNGWGKALVEALIVHAQAQRILTLFALTRAVPFFQKLGFRVSQKRAFPEKIWRDCQICPVRADCDETAVVLRFENA